MGKIKVTQAQADLIKSIKDTDYAINIHGLNKRPDSPLQELTTAELARALYIGYEVEPEFKVGDWVVVHGYSKEYDGKVLEITEIFKGTWNLRYCKFSPSIDQEHNFCLDDTDVRHATPEEIAEEKERRWWAKYGRGVWELKKGDVVVNKHSGIIRVITSVLAEGVRLDDSCNMICFDAIKNNNEILCFAEDRKDV